MDNTNEKIRALYTQLSDQKERFRKSAARSALLYVLLAAFVLVYTSVLYVKIVSSATPSAVAELLSVSARKQLPELRAKLKQEYPSLAETAAARTVDAAEALIPAAGQYVRNQISISADKIMDDLESERIPVIETILSEAVGEALAEHEKIGTDNLAKTISNLSSARIHEEMENCFNDNFYKSVADLKNKIDTLRTTPWTTANRRLQAEKMFLIYWIRLTEISDGKTGIFAPAACLSEQMVVHLSSEGNTLKTDK